VFEHTRDQIESKQTFRVMENFDVLQLLTVGNAASLEYDIQKFVCYKIAQRTIRRIC
jgi:hypothetical protein